MNSLKILEHYNAGRAEGCGNPVTVEIDPSSACNHNCEWCFYKEYNKNKQLLNNELFYKLINDLGKGGVKGLIFSGAGEPLIHQKIKDTLYLAKKYNIETGIITNGSLMNELARKAIVDNCSWARISLDAITAEEHTRVHGTKDFDLIINNIENLVKMKGSELTVGLSFTNSNEPQDKIIDFAKSLGIDKEDVAIRGLREEQCRNYKVCRIHNFISVIGPDAKVYPCCSYLGNEKFCYGSLEEKSFWDIWNGEKRKEIIKKINPIECPPCRYDLYNEILEYLGGDKKHKNFL